MQPTYTELFAEAERIADYLMLDTMPILVPISDLGLGSCYLHDSNTLIVDLKHCEQTGTPWQQVLAHEMCHAWQHEFQRLRPLADGFWFWKNEAYFKLDTPASQLPWEIEARQFEFTWMSLKQTETQHDTDTTAQAS